MVTHDCQFSAGSSKILYIVMIVEAARIFSAFLEKVLAAASSAAELDCCG